jgi:hypothetical protein
LRFLESVVQSGKVRALGVGTSIEEVLKILRLAPRLAQVLQFASSPLDRNVAKIPFRPEGLVITHGTLNLGYRPLLERLTPNVVLRRRWSEELGGDILDDGRLSAYLLNDSLRENPNGFVLFSSKDAARIRQNALSVLDDSRRPSADRVRRFGELISQDIVQSAEMVRRPATPPQ